MTAQTRPKPRRQDYRTPCRLEYVRHHGRMCTTPESWRQWHREVLGFDTPLFDSWREDLLPLDVLADTIGMDFSTVWRWCVLGRRPFMRPKMKA